METITSAIVGEFFSRFVSFLTSKYTDRACPEKDQEKLQNLLLRVRAVVEEAEGRYITNSTMLTQLKTIVESMYRGYYILDTFKYKPLEEMMIKDEGEVSSSCSLSYSYPAKRLRTTASTTKSISVVDDLKSTLKNLETIVSNMTEFVILLGACERMHRKPYDTYLYLDNFMFGHVVEKQRIINFLLQDSPSFGAPVVLPVIGGCCIGKKTLVGYACSDTRVCSHFTSILHLKGDDIWRMHHGLFRRVKTLVVIEFRSDVDDEDWLKFCSSATRLGRGSKVIVISRHETIARFGAVKPISLNRLLNEECVYLFKVLAFGSANPKDHPQLESIGIEIAVMLQGLLLSANVIADMLRKNLNVQFWLRILNRCRNGVDNNFSIFGEHPKALMDKDHPVDLTKLAPPSTTLCLIPPRSKGVDACKEKSKLTFGDLIAGCNIVLPKEEEFEILVWESRIPPFTKYVATCVQEKKLCAATWKKKRRGLYK